ncbi:UNVERIFIED_CONTAM: hypothetical protein Slati_1612700 [Sesamum latifolium]|uniref:Iron-related transcription factor 3 bHLH domain-containing protein n=1 Tax=Sesamum latifolium TaxID=2727402 RepID=A0AAW2X9T5_9LAMI
MLAGGGCRTHAHACHSNPPHLPSHNCPIQLFLLLWYNFAEFQVNFYRMGSETAHPVDDGVEIHTSKKSTGKVPRKIHKAAREKLKRDQMNELFLDWGEHLVTIEKNELLEETSGLDDQIKSLQREIDEKANRSDLNVSEPQNSASAQLLEDPVAFPLVGHASESTSVVTPVLVMPLHHECQGFPSPFPEVNMSKVPSSVSRPQPRYPSSSDSWPSHILTK